MSEVHLYGTRCNTVGTVPHTHRNDRDLGHHQHGHHERCVAASVSLFHVIIQKWLYYEMRSISYLKDFS